MLLLGRGLSGVGAANSTLGFSYIAAVIPREDLTKSSAFLSMMRVAGMALAPGLNFFLSEVNLTIPFLGSTFELNPLNAVGVLLAISNILAFLAIFFFLKEPELKTNESKNSSETTDERSLKFWIEVLSPDVLVPVLAVFALNANFQLMETGLAPAAKNVLGWGPVAISTLFGLNAVVIFVAIIGVFMLSSKGTSDENLNFAGLGFSIAGYLSMYLLWTEDAVLWTFALPVVLSTLAFPFLGTSTRSIFTKLVDANPILAGHQGTMQALLSMAASVAGFVAPGLVASYILRSPEDIDASNDKHEFTIYALFAPTLSLIVLVGMIYLHVYRGGELHRKTNQADGLVNETMSLLNQPSTKPSRRVTEPAIQYSPQVEAERRATTTLMGIPQFSYHESLVMDKDSLRKALGLSDEEFATIEEE